jgi:hypothetical protein
VDDGSINDLMRCKDVADPKRADDGGEDVVVNGKRKRRSATREELMKDQTFNLEEGSPFIVYSNVQEGSVVTLRRSTLLLWEEPG